MAQTSELTPTDFIKQTIGQLMFVYYLFLETYHTRPVDMNDLVDGLLYMDARGYLDKKQREEARALAESRQRSNRWAG